MTPFPYSLAEPFLVLAVVLFFIDLFLLGRKRTKATGFQLKISSLASLLGCILVAFSYLLLTRGFLTDSFFLSEVYSYSSSSLSSAFKMGGPWISGNGSLLFIALLLAILYLAYRGGMSRPEPSAFRVSTYRVIDVILIIFILVPLLQSPFAEVVPEPPDGVGLSPLLQTFWVLIHPPIIFGGYVLVFFAFAMMAAALITGQREELKSRWYSGSLMAAWLFLALGIALGGYWSYIVLGWGGYWAWDPVETASLLPWLALTAYFHLPAKGNGRLRDLLVTATFALVVYATAVTRGGFSPSLHAFGASAVGYLYLAMAIVFVVYILNLMKERRQGPLFKADLSSVSSLSLTVAFASLVALLIVCFIGVTLPVLGGIAGIPFSIGGEFFVAGCFPFVLALAAAFIGCEGFVTRKRFAFILVMSLAAGAICSLLRFPTQNIFADFGLPLLIVSGGIILVRLGSSLGRNPLSTKVWGKSLIHLSLILILVGVVLSSAGETETLSFPVHAGSSVDLFGTSVTVNDIVIHPGEGDVYYPSHDFVGPERSGFEVIADVKNSEIRQQLPLRMSYYPQYGMFSEPAIISTPGRDIYLSVNPSNTSQDTLMSALMGMEAIPGDVVLSGKVVPWISLIWAGILTMMAGMTLALAGVLLRRPGT